MLTCVCAVLFMVARTQSHETVTEEITFNGTIKTDTERIESEYDIDVGGDDLDNNTADLSRRIIGGKLIKDQDLMPWLVRIEGNAPNKEFISIFRYAYQKVHCGGSVVSRWWILSAAHCFVRPGVNSHLSLDAKYYTIYVGNADEHNAKAVKAQKIIVHQFYSKNNMWKNDIALIKLEHALKIKPHHVVRINFPVRHKTIHGWPHTYQHCYIGGWGCTVTAGPQEIKAHWTTLDAVSTKVCERIYGKKMSDSRLCAGPLTREDPHGVCSGDSGGPLVCRKQNINMWVQAGVASFTNKLDAGGTPSIFTRVAYYQDWIKTVIDRN